jgi:hypothetical protein
MIFFPILFSKKKIKDVDFIVQDVPVVEIDDEVSDNNQGIDTFDIISNVSNGFYNKIFLAPNVDEGQDIHIQSISQEIRVDEVLFFFFFSNQPIFDEYLDDDQQNVSTVSWEPFNYDPVYDDYESESREGKEANMVVYVQDVVLRTKDIQGKSHLQLE